jgi:iron complex outermembrane receptor protein
MKKGFDLRKGGKFITGMLVVCLAFMMFGVCYAEEDAAATKESEVHSLGAIVVSARKVEENVQDVPASISVFTDLEMENAGIDTILDITRLSPNVSMRQNGTENFVLIRGISIPHTTLSGPTGFYIDDVARSNPYMNDLALYDLERVEVLKGPQGTLYGRNSLSGVVNVITRQPGNEFQGKVMAGYNIWDTEHGSSPGYRLGVNLSGPLVQDKLAAGIAGLLDQTDGYMKNLYDQDDEALKEDRKNLRGTLRFTPSDPLEITFIADVMDGDNGNGFYRYATGPDSTERHQIDWDGSNRWEEESNSQTFRVKYTGEGFNLLSVTGKTHDYSEFDTDYDFTSVAPGWGNMLVEYGGDMWSQEFRLSSQENRTPIEWLVGVSAFTEDIDSRVEYDAWGEIRDTDIERTGYALFGQATYTVRGKLHLTAGMRYDHLDLKGEQNYSVGAFQARYKAEKDGGEVLPKFSAAYDFLENVMGYATASKGYLPGGVNYAFVTDNDNFVYDPEFAWSYEIGLKNMLMDNKLQFNASIFYVDMKDKQVIQWLSPTERTIENAADAHSQGFELELRMMPIQGLDLFAGYGYTEAEFDDYMASQADGSTEDYSGNILPNVAQYTYNIGAQYTHLSGFFGRFDIVAADEFYTDAGNVSKGGDYTLVNLRLGYQGEAFDVILWGENITDEEYDSKIWDFPGMPVVKDDGPPRRIGATLTWRF